LELPKTSVAKEGPKQEIITTLRGRSNDPLLFVHFLFKIERECLNMNVNRQERLKQLRNKIERLNAEVEYLEKLEILEDNQLSDLTKNSTSASDNQLSNQGVSKDLG